MKKRHEIFIKEFVLTRNAMQSYIKAGYKPKSAQKNAHKLRNNKEISKRIDEEFDRIAKEYEFKECDVYKGIHEIATNGTVEANKLRAHELKAKILGLLKDNNVNVAVYQSLDKEKVKKVRKLLKTRGLGK